VDAVNINLKLKRPARVCSLMIPTVSVDPGQYAGTETGQDDLIDQKEILPCDGF
jgi:hypothetical protein